MLYKGKKNVCTNKLATSRTMNYPAKRGNPKYWELLLLSMPQSMPREILNMGKLLNCKNQSTTKHPHPIAAKINK